LALRVLTGQCRLRSRPDPTCECGATVLVVPRGVLPRRRYSAQAIARAFAVEGRRPKATSPRVVAQSTVRRWCHLVERGGLFAHPPPLAHTWSFAHRAERIAHVLAGYALDSHGQLERAELGVSIVMGLNGSAGVFRPPPKRIGSTPSPRRMVRDGDNQPHRRDGSTKAGSAQRGVRLVRRTGYIAPITNVVSAVHDSDDHRPACALHHHRA
jgi:hypothetical protein